MLAAMASLEHVTGTQGMKRQGQYQTALQMLQRPVLNKGKQPRQTSQIEPKTQYHYLRCQLSHVSPTSL